MLAHKDILCISDLHCGHRYGILPSECISTSLRIPTSPKWEEWQEKSWGFVESTLQQITPKKGFDAVFALGDNIDGNARKNGGVELLTSNRDEQVAIAAAFYSHIKRRMTVMVRGTPYHVGTEENWEDILAREIKADKIGDHEWPEVNGVIFDLKHKVGSSSVPHGRHTAPSRAAVWNMLWAERKMQPKARVFLRGHAHYYDISGNSRQLSMILPALQGWTGFGAKECEGTVDFGMITFRVYEDGSFTWQEHFMDMTFAAAQILKI